MQTLLGITGLVWAQPVADVLSLVLVAVLYIFTMRKMKTETISATKAEAGKGLLIGKNS